MSAAVKEPAARPHPVLTHRILLAAALLAAAGAGYAAFLHAQVIANPWPMEYREPAATVVTALLLDGGNPFRLENLPVHTNVYGVGYSLIVLPFAKLLGNGFLVHRAVSAGFIVACCAVIYGAIRQLTGRRTAAVVGALLMYATLAARTADMQPYGMPASILARPDAPGLFFFLLAMLVPLRRQFDGRGLICSGVLTVIAFLIKPYFVIAFPIVAAYVFVVRSRRVGAIALAWYMVAMVAVLGLVSLVVPAFVPIVLVGNQYSITTSTPHLVEQLVELLKQSPGVLAIVAIAFIAGIARRRLDYLGFVAVCCATYLLLSAGRHSGNSMLYFHHLLTPWLLIIACRLVAQLGRPALAGLLLVDVVILLFTLPPVPQRHDQAWREWQALLSSADHVYAAPPLADLLRQQGKTVYDQGLSEYYCHSFEEPVLPWSSAYEQHYRRWLDDLYDQIRRREFDLVILPYYRDAPMPAFTSKPLLRAHYVEVDRRPLPMDWSPGFVGVVLRPKDKPESP